MLPLEKALILLRKARQDLVVVTKGLTDPEIADEIIGFHVQQAGEKCLKSVLSVRSALDRDLDSNARHGDLALVRQPIRFLFTLCVLTILASLIAAPAFAKSMSGRTAFHSTLKRHKPHFPPQELLDLRDAPAPLVFMLMLGNFGNIDDRIRGNITFRLTDRAIHYTGNVSDNPGFGDYYTNVGWLKTIETALHAGKLFVGSEREAGGELYVYFDEKAAASNSLFFYNTEHTGRFPDLIWLRLSPPPVKMDAVPALTNDIPDYRVAGLHWYRKTPSESSALLLYRRADGAEFGRVIMKGSAITPNLSVQNIDSGSVTLWLKRSNAADAQVILTLRGRVSL